MVTFQLYWWKRSGASLCIISNTTTNPSRTKDVPLAGLIASSYDKIWNPWWWAIFYRKYFLRISIESERLLDNPTLFIHIFNIYKSPKLMLSEEKLIYLVTNKSVSSHLRFEVPHHQTWIHRPRSCRGIILYEYQ
jgi:hypothetical protein